MTRNHFWKLVITLAILGWSLIQIFPPLDKPLVAAFRERAIKPDETFNRILEEHDKLAADNPDAQYANLRKAIGTNSITQYFPFYDTKKESDPTRFILGRLQREAAGKIKLGIDLKGGTAVTMEMDTSQLPAGSEHQNIIGEAVEVVRRRVDKLGVAEPVIQPQGHNRIIVQLPGLSEADKDNAVETLKRAAFLEFRLVHEHSNELLSQNLVEPGYEVMTREDTSEDGTVRAEKYLVERKPAGGLTGKNVSRVRLDRDMNGRLQVAFSLDSEGAAIFARVTRENVGRLLAIVLDGQLRSAPIIKGEIPGGNGVIEGGARGFSTKEAVDLANVLQNPLKAPLKLMSSESVEASLGKDAIASGLEASIIAAVGTFIFMLVFYFFGGLIANFALALNVLILTGVMCSLGATFTLPGIAGVALTIGMAVDANVLIFERIREELAAGKSLRGALAAGYDKAFGAIFDSNLTTLISSAILIWLGTGAVKGFGVTLSIGVLASMFTALVVTRLIFDFLILKGIIKSLPMLPTIKNRNLDFMRWARMAFVVTWVISVIGLGYGIARGSKSLGVDFVGGEEQVYKLKMPESDSGKEELRRQVRELGDKLKMGDVTPQIQRPIAGGNATLRLITPFSGDTNSSAQVFYQALRDQLPQYEFERPSVNRVGPIVGQAITEAAIIASLLALFAILVYVAFRYEFSFAVGAVLAVIHDVLLSIGIFFLIGGQLSAAVVAAILTIIGYSINDKIVNLDRIREDLKLGVRGSFLELINLALNQTLSRTIITGGSVILATLALWVFGGGVIKDFAFVFLVGIVAGTYSSIFIASPIVLWWNKGQRPKIGSGALQSEVQPQAVPAATRA
jgi:SecD/SecF fusion protein